MKKLILSILFWAGCTPAFALSALGTSEATCVPVGHCTFVAYSTLNTAHVPGTADFKLGLAEARTRRLAEITTAINTKIATAQSTTVVVSMSKQARIDTYIAQLQALQTTVSTVLAAKTSVSAILDYTPQYPNAVP